MAFISQSIEIKAYKDNNNNNKIYLKIYPQYNKIQVCRLYKNMVSTFLLYNAY